MSRVSFQFEVSNEEGTAALGRALAKALPSRALVGLNGALGAGKTRLVQSFAEASGIERRMVNSPTFVIVQEYHGSRTIYHADAYRLRDEDEFLQLGLDEYFDQDVVVMIEWADRVASVLPLERIDILFQVLPGESRMFEVVPRSPRMEMVVLQLREALQNELA